MPSLSAQIRAGVLWRSGGQLTAQLLLWGSTLLVLRLLQPADYGLVALASVVTGFLALMSGQGFTAALVQAPDLSARQTRRFLGFLLGVNAALALVQLALAPLAATLYAEPRVADLLRVQALAYLAIPFAAAPAALAQRALDFRTSTLIDSGAAVGGALATLALALAGAGVWSLVAGQLVPTFLRALAYAVTSYGIAPAFGRVGALAGFGGAVTLNGVVWFLYAQSDVFIAGRLLSTVEVGLYATAFFLAALPVSKLMPILNEVGFGAYARVAKDREAVARGLRKAARIVGAVVFPIALGLAASAPIAVPVLLGYKWAEAAAPVTLIAIAMPLYAMANLFGPAVNALGLPRVQLGNALLGLLIMPAAFWAGARHGPVGIAAAWALAYPVLFALSARRSLRVVGVTPVEFARDAGPPLIAAAIMGVTVAAFARSAQPSLPALAFIVALGVGLYAALLRFGWPARWAEVVALVRPQAAAM